LDIGFLGHALGSFQALPVCDGAAIVAWIELAAFNLTIYYSTKVRFCDKVAGILILVGRDSGFDRRIFGS
jgi:hypothetical protein